MINTPVGVAQFFDVPPAGLEPAATASESRGGYQRSASSSTSQPARWYGQVNGTFDDQHGPAERWWGCIAIPYSDNRSPHVTG